MSPVQADPARLAVLDREVSPRLVRLESAAADYAAALAALRAEPGAPPGPCLQDLSGPVLDVTHRLRRATHEVDVFAEALMALDGRMVAGLRRVLPEELVSFGRRLSGHVQPVADRQRDGALAVHLGRASVHGTRALTALQHLVALRREYHTPLAFTGDVAVHQRLLRARRAGLRVRIDRLTGSARSEWGALRRGRPVTGVGRWIEGAPSGPGRWLRHGGKALGGAGAFISAGETVRHLARGEHEEAAISGLVTTGGALMIVPGAGFVGAGVVVVGLGVQHRERVAAGARWVGGKVGDAGRAVADGARRAAGHVRDGATRVGSAAGRTAGKVSDGVSGAASKVGGWLGR